MRTVAAAENWLLVSHDVNTMTAAFKARIGAGTPVPGLLLVPQTLSVGDAIAELELICRATEPFDWAGLVRAPHSACLPHRARRRPRASPRAGPKGRARGEHGAEPAIWGRPRARSDPRVGAPKPSAKPKPTSSG